MSSGLERSSLRQALWIVADPGWDVSRLFWALPQYCSLKDFDTPRKINPDRAAGPARPQLVVAHLPLYPARVDAIAARTHALLQNLLEHDPFKDFFLLRGE